MKVLKDVFFLLVGLAFVGGSLYFVWNKPAGEVIRVGDKTILVEIADTPEERAQGLSGRAGLPAGHGVLFVFDSHGLYGFWMKEMNFSIDIIWLSEEFQVIDIARSVSPNTFPHVFYPPRPVKYVLETNPGEL